MRRTCRVVLVACSVSAEHIGGEPTVSAAERGTETSGYLGRQRRLCGFAFKGFLRTPSLTSPTGAPEAPCGQESKAGLRTPCADSDWHCDAGKCVERRC